MDAESGQRPPEPPDVRACAGCGYPLRGLSGRPCPECGGRAQHVGVFSVWEAVARLAPLWVALFACMQAFDEFRGRPGSVGRAGMLLATLTAGVVNALVTVGALAWADALRRARIVTDEPARDRPAGPGWRIGVMGLLAGGATAAVVLAAAVAGARMR